MLDTVFVGRCLQELFTRQRIAENDVYSVPYSLHSPMSLVDLLDVAKAASIVLSDPGHASATYELAGPEVPTPH